MTAITKKSDKINFGALRRFDQNFHRKLNDIYIDTSAIASYLGIAATAADNELIKRIPRNIEVPSHSGSASVKRSTEQVHEIFRIAAENGQWEKSLTFAISVTEDMVASYIKLLLRSKPILIMISMKGKDAEITVSLAEIINRGADKIIEDRVLARAIGALYAAPAEYIKYIEELLKFDLPETVMAQYIEMKARRDIIIHGNGLVNDLYLQKIKDHPTKSRIGDKLSVDRIYFEESMRVMKRFGKTLSEQFIKEYGDDTDVQAVIAAGGI